MNKHAKLQNSGFSLVELIVVVAVLVVLLGILAPSLLRYTENSRVQKDESAMDEICTAVKYAMADAEIFDEAYSYAITNNYLTYSDSSGIYGSKYTDEEYWAPDGLGHALTITFNPDENGNYIIAKGIVNDMTYGNGSVADTRSSDALQQCYFSEMGNQLLYSKVQQTIGESFSEKSATYKNSSYTVFVTFEAVNGIKRAEVYGEFNGTNLATDSPASLGSGTVSYETTTGDAIETRPSGGKQEAVYDNTSLTGSGSVPSTETPSYKPVMPDSWDGTVNTGWYNATDTEFILMTCEDVAGFAQLVDGGNTFAGKTVKIGNNMSFAGYTFNSIGTSSKTFNGVFDGQDYTLSHITQDSRAAGTDGARGGFFDTLNGATIRNLTLDSCYLTGLSKSKETMIGTLAAGAKGNCNISNITVSNTTLLQNSGFAGGLIGQVSGGTQTYSNINIPVSTKLQAGKVPNNVMPADTCLGGVIAYVSNTSARITMNNCNVACVIDAYADIIGANHVAESYRYCGMLIGYSTQKTSIGNKIYLASASYLTCNNVKVTYGAWSQYTYCEFRDKTVLNHPDCPTYGRAHPYTINGVTYNPQSDPNPQPGNTYWEYVRVQSGAEMTGVGSIPHTHNEDEDHERLLAFNQLIGTGDGNGTTANRGNPEHPGVTVIH